MTFKPPTSSWLTTWSCNSSHLEDYPVLFDSDVYDLTLDESLNVSVDNLRILLMRTMNSSRNNLQGKPEEERMIIEEFIVT